MPPPIQQANLGMADSLILMVLALVVFGPRRLPQIGRQIGKLMYEFRKASNDFKFQMEEELRSAEEADRRKKEEAERQQRLALSAPAQTASETAALPAGEANAPAAEESGYVSDVGYPRESTHGDFGGQDAVAEAHDAPKEASSAPRISPPSTGEQVAASRPGVVSAEHAEAQPAPAAERNGTEKEPAAEQTSAVTEQATHNG
jgi:sec-independent protein translocase protein TatB